jgi:hypothetical protein
MELTAQHDPARDATQPDPTQPTHPISIEELGRLARQVLTQPGRVPTEVRPRVHDLIEAIDAYERGRDLLGSFLWGHLTPSERRRIAKTDVEVAQERLREIARRLRRLHVEEGLRASAPAVFGRSSEALAS